MMDGVSKMGLDLVVKEGTKSLSVFCLMRWVRNEKGSCLAMEVGRRAREAWYSCSASSAAFRQALASSRLG